MVKPDAEICEPGKLTRVGSAQCVRRACSAWTADQNCSRKLLHLVQKPTHVFLYISVETVQIYTKFSGYVWEELGLGILRT